MRDLTKNSISGHILTLSMPVIVSVFAQIAYQLVALYFVAKIAVASVAGVNAAGNVFLLINAAIQTIAAGTMPLVAHAVGRRDDADAKLVLNQSLVLSIVCGTTAILLLLLLIRPYLRSIVADEATLEAGTTFLMWMLPAYALSLPMAVLSAALRGAGITWLSVVAFGLTLVVNIALAPTLIAGWGTGRPLGVLGAGLATSISVLIGLVFLHANFGRVQRHMIIERWLPRPDLHQWSRVLNVGLPAGGEFALSFVSAAIVYYALRDLGSSAQAGYGIGFRVLQTLLLPAVAIAFAAGPVAGQNFGAKNGERVLETFRKAALFGIALMAITTVLVQLLSTELVEMFGTDAAAHSVAIIFLKLMSWTLVVQSFVYTCSTMFQGLGNTVPSLISSGIRVVAFAIPTVWLSSQAALHIEHIWYLLITSVVLQMIISSWLLRLEFIRRLDLSPTNLRPRYPAGQFSGRSTPDDSNAR